MESEDQVSTGLLPTAEKASLLDGSFHSRSSFNAPGVGEAYDKTLFNLCYLVQLQLGIFFRQEEFDERTFCRYYLKLYMRLKDMDRGKHTGPKYSKAFSEFTVLVYHNLFGGEGEDGGGALESKKIRHNQSSSQPSRSGVGASDTLKRKVTFAGSDKDAGSSLGLHPIDEDSDLEQKGASPPKETTLDIKLARKADRQKQPIKKRRQEPRQEEDDYQVDQKGAGSIHQSLERVPVLTTTTGEAHSANEHHENSLSSKVRLLAGTGLTSPHSRATQPNRLVSKDHIMKGQALSEMNVSVSKKATTTSMKEAGKPAEDASSQPTQLGQASASQPIQIESSEEKTQKARTNSMTETPAEMHERVVTPTKESQATQAQSAPTQVVMKSQKLAQAQSKSGRESLKQDFQQKIEKVLQKNLKSGSYVLEQDGSMVSEKVLASRISNQHHHSQRNKSEQQRGSSHKTGDSTQQSRNSVKLPNRSVVAKGTHEGKIKVPPLNGAGTGSQEGSSAAVQNSQYHTQLDNCYIIMINKNYNNGGSGKEATPTKTPTSLQVSSKAGSQPHRADKTDSPSSLSRGRISRTSQKTPDIVNSRTPSRFNKGIEDGDSSDLSVESDHRNRSLVVKRNRKNNSRLNQCDSNARSGDRLTLTQSLEEMAAGIKKVKKRKLREASQQPQYVIVDDPNQLLPKTRRVKKVTATTQQQPKTPQQKLYLAVQAIKNPESKTKATTLHPIVLQSDGNHYKITKVKDQFNVKKVTSGKDGPDQKHTNASSKSPKSRKLIQNSSMKFANHRQGGNSPGPIKAELPFQIAPNQQRMLRQNIEEQIGGRVEDNIVLSSASQWFKNQGVRLAEQPQQQFQSRHNRIASYSDEINLPVDLAINNGRGRQASLASSFSNPYRSIQVDRAPQVPSTSRPEVIRPSTNASAFTTDSLGLTRRVVISQSGAVNNPSGQGGLVSSRKQGSIVTSGLNKNQARQLQTSHYHGRNSKDNLRDELEAGAYSLPQTSQGKSPHTQASDAGKFVIPNGRSQRMGTAGDPLPSIKFTARNNHKLTK